MTALDGLSAAAGPGIQAPDAPRLLDQQTDPADLAETLATERPRPAAASPALPLTVPLASPLPAPVALSAPAVGSPRARPRDPAEAEPTPPAGPPRGRRRRNPEPDEPTASGPEGELAQTVVPPRPPAPQPSPGSIAAIRTETSKPATLIPAQPQPRPAAVIASESVKRRRNLLVPEPEGTAPEEFAETVLMSRIAVLPPTRPAAPARDEFAWDEELARDGEQDPYGDERLWRPELFTASVKTTGTVLPKPPSRRSEKYLYNNRRMGVLMLGMVVSAPFLLYTQLGFLANSMRLWVLFPVVMMTPVVIIIRLLLEIGTRGFDFDAHNKLVGEWAPRTCPSVDVLLPVCGESLEVLRNTWKHVAVLQESYPGVVTVYVLDDAARDVVATMAAEFGFRYGSRPNRGWFKKAGNLNFGLERSSGEFVLILDADFVPSPDMLEETLPYFDADPRLGILQTPQFFRNEGEQSFIERGAATSQELFYRAVQVARDQRDSVVCCGTNAVYRRAALAENNGITLISHSEDAHTGIDLRRLGWHVRYLPVNLASGLCPADVDSFFSQQYRWCVGTISIVADRGFWTSRMPLRARLYDVVGFLYYVETGMFTILSPLIAVILCLITPHQVILRNYLLVAPSALYSFVIIPLWHRVRCGTDMWPVTVIVSWSNIFAFWDALRGRQMSWRPSGGVKKGNRRLWLGLWTWSLGMAVVGVVLSGWRMLEMNTAAFTPIFLPAVFYLVTIIRILGTKWTSPADA